MFAEHLTGKYLSFDFYPKAVYFECKFWIFRSAITRDEDCPIGPQRVGFHGKMTSKAHYLKLSARECSLLCMENASLKAQNSPAAY